MELQSINHINEQYMQYSDQRSVMKFLKGKGLSIIRLGKKRFIQKDEFENMIHNIVDRDNTIKEIHKKLKLTDQEKTIHSHLLKNLTEL